jgi:hypothetical protein
MVTCFCPILYRLFACGCSTFATLYVSLLHRTVFSIADVPHNILFARRWCNVLHFIRCHQLREPKLVCSHGRGHVTLEDNCGRVVAVRCSWHHVGYTDSYVAHSLPVVCVWLLHFCDTPSLVVASYSIFHRRRRSQHPLRSSVVQCSPLHLLSSAVRTETRLQPWRCPLWHGTVEDHRGRVVAADGTRADLFGRR